MQSGQQLAERWELLVEGPGEREVERWRAVDRDTGEPVEVLVLRSPGAFRPEAHQRFADLHRRLARTVEPGLVRTHAVRRAAGFAFVIREPLEDATLRDIPGPLPPAEVAAIGARLHPVVVAAAGATGSALSDQDLGIDAAGRPVLAPRGRPSARVGPDDVRWVAPEAFQGCPPDGAAGLYGLGVTLHRLATGRDPVRPQRIGGEPPRASTLRVGLPPALDEAIHRLLSPDPTRRAAALPLLHESAGALPDLRGRVVRAEAAMGTRRVIEAGTVKVTTSSDRDGSGQRAREDVAALPVAITVPVEALSRLDPASRSAVAGFANVPVSVIEALARAGLPLPLERHRSTVEARRRADALHDGLQIPLETSEPAGWVTPILAALIGIAGLAWAVGGWIAGFTAFAIAALLVTAIVVAGTSARWLARHAARSRVDEAARRIRDDRSAKAADPEIAGLWDRLATLRRQLTQADVPDAAALDLRGAVDDVERHLEDIVRVGAAARETLGQVDKDQLHTRLRGLVDRAGSDPEIARERDRLSRTIADLDEISARAERARADADRIGSALDELSAVLAQVNADTSADGQAVEQLARTTRLARESLVSSDEPPRPSRQRETR